MANPVVWFEITGKKPAKTKKFYADLFGWKIEGKGYGHVKAGSKDGIPGGICGAYGKKEKPRTTFYVEVKDLGKALKKAEGLGGKTLLKPMSVGEGTSIAHFADIDGNVVGLVQND